MPLLSVLFPVYNGENYMVEALTSVLSQSFTDLEVILVNDGSTDKTGEICRNFAESDSRIVFLENSSNMGLVATLNRALESSSGTFIARMDHDDICLPDRFSKQVEFLLNNPDVDVLGTQCEIFDAGGRTRLTHQPTQSAEIAISMIFNCCLVHPTIVARRANFDRYDPNFLHAEDYALWLSMLASGKRFANIDTPLLRLRKHTGNISHQFSSIQKLNSLKAVHTTLSLLTKSEVKFSTVSVLRQGKASTQHEFADAISLLETVEKALLSQSHWNDTDRKILSEQVSKFKKAINNNTTKTEHGK